MMKIVNDGIELHQEAWEALDKARTAGWAEAYVYKINGNRWPYVGLSNSKRVGLVLHTQPGYLSQAIYDPGRFNLSYGWNRDILTPAQVDALIKILETGSVYESPTCPCCGQELVTVPGTEKVGCPEGC